MQKDRFLVKHSRCPFKKDLSPLKSTTLDSKYHSKAYYRTLQFAFCLRNWTETQNKHWTKMQTKLGLLASKSVPRRLRQEGFKVEDSLRYTRRPYTDTHICTHAHAGYPGHFMTVSAVQTLRVINITKGENTVFSSTEARECVQLPGNCSYRLLSATL